MGPPLVLSSLRRMEQSWRMSLLSRLSMLSPMTASAAREGWPLSRLTHPLLLGDKTAPQGSSRVVEEEEVCGKCLGNKYS